MAVFQILLVEDDKDDIFFFEEAISNVNLDFKLNSIMQGDEVIPYLKKCGTLPSIIVMDLNLPRVHGRELLTEIKANPIFKAIPVIILTTSAAPEDSEYCLAHGAERFFTKPNSIGDYSSVIAAVTEIALEGKAVERK